MAAAEQILLPPLACETHSHVFGDPQAFPVRAGHAIPSGGSLDNYLKISRALGVQRHVLVQALAYGTDTRWLLQALADVGIERSRGVIVADASLTPEDLAQLHQRGVRGVRFLFGPDDAVDTAAILAMARRIAPLGWSALVQAPAAALAGAHGTLAVADCPVVLDHMGRVPPGMRTHDAVFQSLLRFLRQGGWIKLSAPYYGTENGASDFSTLRPRLHACLDAAGDRAIWGMNWPHPNLPARHKPDEAATLRSLLAVLPDQASRQALFVDNPARLYGFNCLSNNEGLSVR
ncbi:amidohydrolase family protein [Bradyrhizobium sp. LHD-71]|uniref:amidohydrolase family protein n=1 Tax=Bradyrhizobium sp. LHD-71 TaxID=3072141 RepID=UPI00280EB0AF|nr:amidohydrolase family protein [Bradyrhizobium sp. LHD-71]MDQ8732144.1 amidohydrolase family protein [Bradyrhizobium sp. LHD-71]